MTVRLSDLVKTDKPLSDAQLLLVYEWIGDDWESHDHDRELVMLVKRLLATIEEMR